MEKTDASHILRFGHIHITFVKFISSAKHTQKILKICWILSMVGNIFVEIPERSFQKTIGISIGINCVSLFHCQLISKNLASAYMQSISLLNP